MIEKGFYNIKFSGLKEGNHLFDFDLEKTFFEQFEDYNINSGSGKLEVLLSKKVNLLSLNFKFNCDLISTCDRCNDDLSINISGEDDVYVKFGEEDISNDDESLLVIPSDSYQINIDSTIFELIATQIPLRKIHENEDDCNQEILDKLNNSFTENTDSRWDGLKELLNTK